MIHKPTSQRSKRFEVNWLEFISIATIFFYCQKKAMGVIVKLLFFCIPILLLRKFSYSSHYFRFILLQWLTVLIFVNIIYVRPMHSFLTTFPASHSDPVCQVQYVSTYWTGYSQLIYQYFAGTTKISANFGVAVLDLDTRSF